jgi:hypothetical protein
MIACSRSSVTHVAVLDRPPSPRARWQRDYRRRQRRGEACAWVPYDDVLIKFLVRYRWLDADKQDSKAHIGDAIGRLVRDTAKTAPE